MITLEGLLNLHFYETDIKKNTLKLLFEKHYENNFILSEYNLLNHFSYLSLYNLLFFVEDNNIIFYMFRRDNQFIFIKKEPLEHKCFIILFENNTFYSSKTSFSKIDILKSFHDIKDCLDFSEEIYF